MNLKRLASVAFAISFLMGIVLYTGYGRQYISYPTARTIFVISGGAALLLNLFSFQSSKHNIAYSLIFWTGSVVLFVGLVFMLMALPYSNYILFTGLGITGISFFLPADLIEPKDKDEGLIDDL